MRMDHIDQDTIIQYVTDTFTGLDILRPDDGPGAGDTFIYYDPQRDRDPSHSLPSPPSSSSQQRSRQVQPGMVRVRVSVTAA